MIDEFKVMQDGDLSLAESVAELLRERIITGYYGMGEKLVENTIAKELKVSRTPVRDAFKLLMDERLVEYIPNKGCFAKGFSQKDMSDVYAVRSLVEGLAIKWAIENATEQDITELGNHLDIMEFYTRNHSYTRLLEANEKFHSMIYSMTGSRFIVQIMDMYQDYVHLARSISLKKEDDMDAVFLEHKAIFNAIKNRNVEDGIREAENHMAGSARRANARWKESK